MAQDVWYYAVDDRRQGPVDRGEIDRMWRLGAIGPGTLVWRDGMEDWSPASEVLGPAPSPRRPADPGPGTLDVPPSGGPLVHEGRFDGAAGPGGYHEDVGLAEAMRRAIRRYAEFGGRSNRGEFWWFVLGASLVSVGLATIDLSLFGGDMARLPLTNLWSLATLLPSLAITTRRLHDTDRSGWHQLVGLIPLVGVVVIIVWCAQKGQSHQNRFG